MHRLLENTSLTIANDPCFDDHGHIYPVGSCNGLICLFIVKNAESLLYLWNPATRSLSNKTEIVCRNKVDVYHHSLCPHWWNYGFGYDNSTGTYKIVYLCQLSKEVRVRVLSIGDNVWRNIQSFPDAHISDRGVYVNGSLNWLTIRKRSQYENWKNITIDQFVIISLDFSTETHCPLLPPWGFDKVPLLGPKLAMLMNSLCFCHDFNRTGLIIGMILIDDFNYWHDLLENPSVTIADDHHFQLNNDRVFLTVVGSYNGLLCLVAGSEFYSTIKYYEQKYGQILFYLLNPATRTFTNKIEFICDVYDPFTRSRCKWKFGFGYDNSTDTYKIVAFCLRTNDVRVFNLGHNVWRSIQNFPEVPFEDVCSYLGTGMTDGVYVSGTVNWLVIRNQSQYEFNRTFISVERFVIISIDFSTETYSQIFDEVSLVRTSLAVLMDSLCFSYDLKGTYFIIWQMKEFRVQESWTQFLKISYYTLPRDEYPINKWLKLFPLCLSENGGTLILACGDGEHAILYNLSNNTVEKTRITNTIEWFLAKDYVESLVSAG